MAGTLVALTEPLAEAAVCGSILLAAFSSFLEALHPGVVRERAGTVSFSLRSKRKAAGSASDGGEEVADDQHGGSSRHEPMPDRGLSASHSYVPCHFPKSPLPRPTAQR